ncbi:hypothetical protein F4808DRAFT_49229 [Astrocystis sublimbata]|nr:hypothetical protein F4808DRAFT_49229 [Astrocystis sublimbata]
MSVACVRQRNPTQPEMSSNREGGLPYGLGPFGYNFLDDTSYRDRPEPDNNPILNPNTSYRDRPEPDNNPILNPNENQELSGFLSHVGIVGDDPWLFGEGFDFSGQFGAFVPPELLGHGTSLGPQPDMNPTAMTGFPSRDFSGDFGSFVPLERPHDVMLRSPQIALPSAPHPHLSDAQTSHQQTRPQSQPALRHYRQQPPQRFPPHQASPHMPIDPDDHANAAALLELGQHNIHSDHSNRFAHSHAPHHPHVNRYNGSRSPSNVQSPVFAQSLVRPVPLERAADPDALFVNLITGPQGSTALRPARPPVPEIQFGSDPTFDKSQRFVPAKNESVEEIERRCVNTVHQALEHNISTPNTQPSSPAQSGKANISRDPVSVTEDFHAEENAAASFKKRQWTGTKIDQDHVDPIAQLPPKPIVKKRKPKADLNASPDDVSTTAGTPGKRRKSAASQPKPPRENLTDEQKRENHIQSEKKRRGAIKDGYDDLHFIVPDLLAGGYSKSGKINATIDWVDQLIEGNQRLVSQ